MSYMMAALARAKRNNSNIAYIFDEVLYRAEQLRYYITAHMQAALDHEDFLLYLQPKMNLHTGCIDSAEALTRWQPVDKEMIYPDQFIPVMEENGFCEKLDLYMVEKVCKQLRKWMDAGVCPIEIAVNQTKTLFVKSDYTEKLLEITQKYRIPPQYVVLEISESLSVENFEALKSVICRLNQYGFRWMILAAGILL